MLKPRSPSKPILPVCFTGVTDGNAACVLRHPAPNYCHCKLVLLLGDKNAPEPVRFWGVKASKPGGNNVARPTIRNKGGDYLL